MNYNCPVYQEYKYFLTRQYPGLYRTRQEVTMSPVGITRRNWRFSMQYSVSCCKAPKNSLNETFSRA